MARFEPFRGLRYAPEVDLDSVVAPPYDVIGPEERTALVARSPHNCVQVELPADEPASGRDRFEQAAFLLDQWQTEGVLSRDRDPTFYVVRMSFPDESGRPRSTTGVLGAVELAPTGEGDVLPHERTTPKPKGERLGLQRACRANLSPVWGLSMSAGLSDLLAPDGKPDGEHLGRATDDEGVVHELWRLPPDRAAAVSALVARRPVVLADGHHRYETALAYQSEVRAERGDQPGDQDLVMALVVELAEDELSVRAIHRLLTGLPSGYDLAQGLDAWFEMTPAAVEVDATFLSRMLDAGSLGVVTPAGTWLARPRPDTEAAAEHPLDSARLDVALTGLPPHDVVYQHGVENVVTAVRSGQAQAGVLLRPADVATISSMAEQRLRMPPKTTFFYPKPRTGMVFRLLD
jgi:uncharacterized protein (DUF1015 family)